VPNEHDGWKYNFETAEWYETDPSSAIAMQEARDAHFDEES
jgi:hypothetical protein